MALILLAALLLLGLPFLYSQSASLAGTRSFADSQKARTGSESARNLATALAAYAMLPHLRAPRPGTSDEVDGWTSMEAILSPQNPQVPSALSASTYMLDAGTGHRADDDGSIMLKAEGLGLGFNDTPPQGSSRQAVYLGACVTDESGKLDPNTMSPVLWGRLLQAVGIQDWDDNDVYDANPLNNPGHYACDADTSTGMLAKALAGVRLSLPERRITHLEQLLLANPQQNEPTPHSLRFRLVRAELERLRPYLTLHNPRPGRDGLVDLGTVVQVDAVVHPTLWLDAPPDARRSLMSVGTVLVGEQTVAGGAHQLAVVNGLDEDGNTMRVIGGMPITGPDAVAVAGDAIAIQVPAALNIHQLPVAIRQALGALVGSSSPLPKPDATGPFAPTYPYIPSIGALAQVPLQSNSPVTLLDLINPVRFASELPPLGIASAGTFTIDAAATVTGALGHQTAQDSRTEVVQAVPQEYLLEQRWTTQGAFQALIASRFASRMQSWPVAVERRLDAVTHAAVPPDEHDAVSGTPLVDEVSIRPRILPDIATVPFAPDGQFAERLYLQHVKLDWRAVFGGAGPVPDAQIFDSESFTGTATQRTPALNAAALGTNEVSQIRPDGYHHRAGSHLLYPLATDFTTPTNQRTALLIERDTADPTHEMGARHISLWIKPDHDWDPSQGLITLLEARMPAANAPAEMDQANLGSTNSQNYLGLLYDAAAELLIVALAPPSIEHTHAATFGTAVPADDLGTPWVDERSLGGYGLPLAPHQYADGGSGLSAFTSAYAPNRILHCFKTPAHHGRPHFCAGQWYHIQLAIASDRPEGVSIIVDSMVGRDAVRTAAGGFVDLQDFGDHCTLPCSALAQAIPYQPIRSGVDPGPLVLDIPVLSVRNHIAADGSTRVLAPTSLFPSRGVVRIDDEYVSYDSLSADGVLTHCVRGRRQDTAPTSPDPTQEFPNVQAHAMDSLVAPGGYRLQFSAGWTGRFYHGGCVLGQNLTNGDSSPTSAHRWQVWAPIDKRAPAVSVGRGTWRLPASAPAIPLSATVGVYAQFPMQGIVLFKGNYMYYGRREDASHTLTDLSAIAGWAVQPALPAPAQPRQDIDFSGGNPEAVQLISIQAQAADPLEEGRYNHGNFTGSAFLLAVQDPGGRVEWIRYDHILRAQVPGVAPGGFFLSDSGFDGTTRGQDRTAWPGRDTILFADPDSVFFPGGTSLLLPVQTELGHTGHWLMTGDVVTFMPRTPSASASPNPVVPFQMAVRYAASDAYAPGPGPSIPLADGANDYCSFTSPTPAGILRPQVSPVSDWSLWLRDYEVLCGDCWSGIDLSPTVDNAGTPTALPEPRGYLPRLDVLSTLYGSTGNDARVSVGGQDPDRTLNAAGIDCTIDALAAGGLTHADVGLDGHDRPGSPANAMPNGVVWFFAHGQLTPHIGASLTDLDDVVVMATTPLFDFRLGEMGLVQIDGEVFAYERPTPTDAQAIAATLATLQASPTSGFGNVDRIAPINAPQIQTSGFYGRLIARGLLSTTSSGIAHQMGALTDGPYLYPPSQWPHWPILPAIRLPLGPVLMVGDSTAQSWFRLVAQAPEVGSPIPAPVTMNAPNVLLTSASGFPQTQEMVQLVGPKIHHPSPPPATPDPDAGTYALAPWLRGLYNTPRSITWGSGPVPSIAIGWWPRYASALPHDAATATAAHFRSRVYSWVGFPFSLYGMYWSDALLRKLPREYANASLASIDVDPASVFTEGLNHFFLVEARATADEAFWSGAATSSQPSMDWSRQRGVLINGHPDDAGEAFDTVHDANGCFSKNNRPIPVDGAEMRLSWRYGRAVSGAIRDIADGTGRGPIIVESRVRALAPVRVVSSNDR